MKYIICGILSFTFGMYLSMWISRPPSSITRQISPGHELWLTNNGVVIHMYMEKR